MIMQRRSAIRSAVLGEPMEPLQSLLQNVRALHCVCDVARIFWWANGGGAGVIIQNTAFKTGDFQDFRLSCNSKSCIEWIRLSYLFICRTSGHIWGTYFRFRGLNAFVARVSGICSEPCKHIWLWVAQKTDRLLIFMLQIRYCMYFQERFQFKHGKAYSCSF